ncbi:hypothetical protein [Ulvibacterium sp.]|uniref:hypothetical protein n=1 Tax=Ulvibacterium sp. TaxID=2665914 RepID=UPI002603EA1E|nr:hypothetical protein [Ulvibacterium sp.]
MENQEINTLKGLEFLAKEHFQMLKFDKNTGKFYVNHLPLDGYQNLFFTLRALINICVMALDTKDFSNTQVIQPEVHVQTVLELAVKLIPFEEGEFLDAMAELLVNKKEIE